MNYAREKIDRKAFYLFISPWLFGVIFLSLFPLIWGFAFSFTNYTGLTLKGVRFVGLANYIEALGDKDFGHGLVRTLLVTLAAVPMKILLGLIIAILLQRIVRGAGLYRTLFYIPVMLPIVSQVHIWNALFHPSAGFLNGLLNTVFGSGLRINWIAEYPSSLLVGLFVWGLGETVVIFFAALQTVPDDLVESANMEGASAFTVMTKIKLPVISPIMFLQVVMNMVKSLQLLTPALLLIPPGSPMAASGRLSTIEVPYPNRLALIHIYEEAFINNRFGYSLSLSWFFFLFTALLGFLFWKVSKSYVYYESDVD